MQAPKGYEKLGLDLSSLWRLHGSLYGLKQAPLIWNKLLDNVLKSFGWRRLLSDWCIYIWQDLKGHLMILAVHVDDMLLAGNSRELMQEVNVTKPTPYSDSSHFSGHFAYHIASPFVIT